MLEVARMLALTGRTLLVLMIVLAVLCVVGVTLLVYGATRPGPRGNRRRIAFILPALALALLGQGFAVVSTALAVNNSYGFYTSWADLTGSGPGQVAISTQSLVGAGQGNVQLNTVHAHTGGLDDRVLVWTPPGYDPHAAHPYPVVMFLPGQPSSPQGTFRHFGFARIASQLVTSHQIMPFVAVFPTLMIAPPRDTECTNIAGSVQAETWLNQDVPAYLTQHYRVQQPGRSWSLLGWSTGGFCSAKLVTGQPGRFGSAAAFGAYYTPLQDHTTGNLFGGNRTLYDHNSPLWLYLHGGLHGSRLLIIAGKQDPESWPETQVMLRATVGDPSVSTLVFPTGGHNFKNYSSYLAQALIWSARTWPA